jgi:hypothetical protein
VAKTKTPFDKRETHVSLHAMPEKQTRTETQVSILKSSAGARIQRANNAQLENRTAK